MEKFIKELRRLTTYVNKAVNGFSIKSGKEVTLYINYSENCWDILKLSIQTFGDENQK